MRKWITFIYVLFAVSLQATESASLQKSQNYWENYYSAKEGVAYPTDFSQACLQYIPKDSTLIELGCGNGRDAFFFGKHGIQVVAYDLSNNVIEKLHRQNPYPHVSFKEGDFTSLDSQLQHAPIGAIYSRFTMHSIPAEAASRVYRWAFDQLAKGGYFFVEVRSIHDPLYGVGEKVARDAYFSDHYRRFIRIDELVKELQEIGFKVENAAESKGFARFKDQDPPVIRIIAKK